MAIDEIFKELNRQINDHVKDMLRNGINGFNFDYDNRRHGMDKFADSLDEAIVIIDNQALIGPLNKTI